MNIRRATLRELDALARRWRRICTKTASQLASKRAALKTIRDEISYRQNPGNCQRCALPMKQQRVLARQFAAENTPLLAIGMRLNPAVMGEAFAL